MESYDVAIAGGGPAGAAAAITLARAGRRVLLADAGRVGPFHVGEGLPPAARPLLRDLGVLERFLADGHRTSFGNVSWWGSDQASPTDFIHNKWGCGYQLDRKRFDALLRVGASQAGAVLRTGRLFMGDSSEACADGHQVRLVCDGHHKEITCRWLVDAGGRPASLARRLGGIRRQEDRLVGTASLLRATVGAADSDGRSLVEASQDGWWYSALLPSGDRIVAYLTDFDLVDHQVLRRKEFFWSHLMTTRMLSALCARHGYQLIGAPRTIDASTGRLNVSAGPAWLAVGDAALSFDPLSSQGITTALHTGIGGAQAIDAALSGAADAIYKYCTHVVAIHEAYLQHRGANYSLERRWPQSLFWQRRHSVPHPQAERHPI